MTNYDDDVNEEVVNKFLKLLTALPSRVSTVFHSYKDEEEDESNIE